MKNLKRALSFALASVMLIGMMVVGAGAADFTDADKIVNDDAVNTLVALNVINGKGDGSYFDPAATLTRAEAAKLIVYILHGGKAPVIGTKAEPTYTDIKGSWAESYIEYCTSTGIIAGKGNGTFGPTETLTGSALAKMLLVAMNYDAEVFGLTGANWEINTNVEANKAGLYEELETVNPSAPISRDNAAQMIFNAIMAPTMYLSWQQNMATGEVTQNYSATGAKLYRSKFGGLEAEGILYYNAAADYDDEKAEYTYDIHTGEYDENSEIVYTFTTETDYTDLFMMNVKALYKVDTNGDVVLYGIYAKNSKVVATGLVGDVTAPAANALKVKIGTTFYKLDNTAGSTYVYENLETTSVGALSDIDFYLDDTYASNGAGEANKAFEGKLIDNDGDGKGDLVVVYPFTVAKVDYVGTKSFSADTTNKFEDVNVYEGIAKNDWVKITAAANTATNTKTFEKIDEIAAKAEAVKTTNKKVQFNGTWYKTDLVTPVAAGSDCKYVEVNGYLFNLKSNSALAGTEDFVLVTKAAAAVAGIDKTQTVQVLNADGTKTTVEVAKVDDKAVADGLASVGTLYTYKINDDGYYELTVAANATNKTVDFDYVAASSNSFNVATSDAKGYITSDGKKYIADDAVIFVEKKGNSTSYAVTTGAALKDTKTSTGVYFVAADADSASGYDYVKLAYVSNSALGKVTKTYGYVTGDVVKYESNEKFYVEIPVGDTTLTTATKADGEAVITAAYALAKGDIFVYEQDAEGKVTKIEEYTMDILAGTDVSNNTAGETVEFYAAITGYADNNVRFVNKLVDNKSGSTVYDATLTEDTVIIYVDQADKTIEEGGSIRLAASEEVESVTAYYANAKAVVDAETEEIVLLVVDVNNDMMDKMA